MRAALGLAACLLAACAPRPTQPTTLMPTDTPRSGYEYQSADTQALQDDPFANPGYLWVDNGRQLFSESPEGGGKSCAECHRGDDHGLRGAAARYPAYDRRTRRLIDLAGTINRCRTERQHAPPLTRGSEPLLALTTYVANLSIGLPFDVRTDGPARAHFEAGRRYFYERRGQLNLACHHCHEQNAGRMLRGDRISEGHGNGYPAYRLEWQRVGSLHRRLQFCNAGVRAEPFALGAAEYLDLELFLAWRAAGLPLETPAVRR